MPGPYGFSSRSSSREIERLPVAPHLGWLCMFGATICVEVMAEPIGAVEVGRPLCVLGLPEEQA